MELEKPSERVWNRAELLADGFTPKGITRAVRGGSLRRLRRDHYVRAGVDNAADIAVRVGGRLTCLSLLVVLGVYVRRNGHVHIHLSHRMSRLRSPASRRRRLSAHNRSSVRLHWSPLRYEPPRRDRVHVFDAIVAAVLCQTPREAIATLDSALHKGLISLHQLTVLFDSLPERLSVLLTLCDGRAESGPESFMRLLLRQAGAVSVEPQVSIPGVGRVDFVVDGWLIIECDSEAHHAGWAAQLRDRRRDLAAAALGYTTIRPVAADITDDPEVVLRAVRGLLASR